ncbi:hypothetical protein [Rhodovulum strictum]|uniref:Uncharacterized protein n=1 Tax=Rhodovulum strictum TaxID=58314 RepID=A0A844BIE0_9RHOB|nr:hypothetical protein [Rhodovulum strictum]MRH20822.1 hypothetical protein [Rhodovulum strictum]
MADGHEEKTSIWTEAGIWLVVLAAMGLWALSIVKWGVLGLYMPAVISVPIILLILVWISRG